MLEGKFQKLSLDDAKLWLKPISELGISDLSISDDDLHYGDIPESAAKYALAAAGELGMPTYSLCKAKPEVKKSSEAIQEKGKPDISGGTKLRGRAVEKFAEGLPTKRCIELKQSLL